MNPAGQPRPTTLEGLGCRALQSRGHFLLLSAVELIKKRVNPGNVGHTLTLDRIGCGHTEGRRATKCSNGDKPKKRPSRLDCRRHTKQRLKKRKNTYTLPLLYSLSHSLSSSLASLFLSSLLASPEVCACGALL